MRVLIVDDDAVSRRVLQDAVHKMGHKVVLARDGLEAWQSIERGGYDILISDWMMPEIDGLELCRRMRAREGEPFCYVLMVTHRSQAEDVVRGIMAGANDFMGKPFDRGELRARLHAAERMVELERSLAKKVQDLEEAMEEVATLRNLIPICMYCKSIRNDEQAWDEIEEYLREHAQADCTHSICPKCYASKVQPMLDDMHRENQAT